MDLACIVFNAARENNLNLLKSALNGRSASEISMLISSKVNGATPLVISCRNGHSKIVEYLLTWCQADVEQVGSVSFDGEPIEDAPPLWCASAAGHLGIVKLLVRHGANVNSTTRTNSTPLRAACFDGHFEIVKYLIHNGADFEVANRHGHTCLMIACYKGHFKIAKYLLSLKANVNRCSVKGNTALHDCAESGSLEILQLLLKHGATMEVDYYGMTPLLAASVTGHVPIVEHLITLPCVTRESRIDALELLGATYVDKKRDMVSALSLWRRAMEERNVVPKIPKEVHEPIAAYEYVTEVTTIEDLEELVLDPDEMRMQALVIRQRILGPTHPDTSYYIRFRGAHYADAGRFDRCIDLWTYALTMQQKILPPLSPMTQSSLLSFAELFSFMMMEAGRLLPRGRVVPSIEACDMLMIFNKAVIEVERGLSNFQKQQLLQSVAATVSSSSSSLAGQSWSMEQQKSSTTTSAAEQHQQEQHQHQHQHHHHHQQQQQVVSSSSSASSSSSSIHDCNNDPNALSRALVSALHIGCLLAWLIDDESCCPKMRRDILVALYKLNRLNVAVRSGRTALHYACYREGTLVGRYPACQFPSPYLAKALLEVGADPNATDDLGNTPLHLAALVYPKWPNIAKVLLDNGAHIDARNKAGETFESLIKPKKIHETVNTLKYTSLACLAAKCIRKHNLSYEGMVPTTLYSFIDMH